LKSDYSLGAALDSYDITVRDSHIGSNGCNALQFGSETVGDFYNITFVNLTLTAAGKAGIGLVSMDGSRIHDVAYADIVMSNVVTPLFVFIGARLRRPLPARVGAIYNIHMRNITATTCVGGRGPWAATLDGQPVDRVANVSTAFAVGPNITLADVDLSACYHGGGTPRDANNNPPHPYNQYPPRELGTRPAYGLFVRNAVGVTFEGLRLGDVPGATAEGRPAVMVENATDILLSNVRESVFVHVRGGEEGGERKRLEGEEGRQPHAWANWAPYACNCMREH